MRRELDQKSSGQVCFIDLQKAFDSLNHEILLEKLKNYGYRGPIHNILADYLSQRFQYVSIRETNSPSRSREIRTGVPQGSILGLFLFLVYINDLPDVCQKSEVAIFADDMSIVNAGKTDDCSVQNGLETLTDWLNYNKLSINTSKCESISFGRMYQRQLTIMEKKISQKNCCKYLGLYIDPVLTFRDHINHVVNKLNKFCGLIYRVRDLYPRKALLLFYNSYAKSVFSYGLIVYGRAAKTNLQNIEMAQRRIIRAIFFKKKGDSIRDILRDTEVNTVFELFIVDVFREIFSQLRSDEKTNLITKLGQSKSTPRYETRRSKEAFLPVSMNRTRTKYKSVENALIKGYNWLIEMDLMPAGVEEMTHRQITSYLKNLTRLYINESRDIVSHFFQ